MSTSQLIANRFKISDPEQDRLGRGGMGEVYRATDIQTGELVAVKALNPQVVARDPELLERFVREGQALRQLNHPNIVRMIAAVQERGQHYLVVEYVSGGSLADMLAAQGRLASTRVMQIALEVADALTRTHHLGIIHRDLKPANVLLAQDGTPRLADFGIAHVESDQRLTQTGILMGTVDYLSPEVCQGEPPDERADIWAFGVMLFQMLTGRLPFEGKSLAAKLTAILTQPAPDLAQFAVDVPDALADLIYRMLAKDPHQRIPSVRLVGAELEAMLKGREPINLPSVTRAGTRFATPTPSANAHAARHNLPVPTTSFVGREAELCELARLLADPGVRLLTIVGVGGIGKTRLGLQAAAEHLGVFADGVWLVELAALSDPALVPQTVAAALDLPGQAARPPQDILSDFLKPCEVLLVLDNCEHLVDACARLADHLLRTCPQLNILATSREVLNIAGEVVFRVPSLTTPDLHHPTPGVTALDYEAVQLFVERAAAALPNFTVTSDNAPAIAQICYHLDGIPLAIELAAARVRALKVEQIAQRLDDRFRLLKSGGRTALPRHQTLRAMIDWSYSLLTEQERILFRRLSVFVGGWSIEAAEAVCAGDGLELSEVLDLLLHLVDKSLILMDERSTETRYRMLETIREYARDQLLESGEADDIQNKHLVFFLELTEEAEPKLQGVEQTAWFKRLEMDHDNIRAALKWSQVTPGHKDTGLRLCDALVPFWMVHGYFREGQRWLEQALTAGGSAPPVLRAKALTGAGTMAWCQSDFQQATALHAESLALYQAVGDKRGITESFNNLGAQALYQGNYEQATSLLQQGLKCYRELGDKSGTALVLVNLGEVARHLGDLEGATARYEESLALYRELGDTRWIAGSIHNLGLVAADRGDLSTAMRLQRESLALFQELGDKQALPECLEKLADLFGAQQHPQRAARLLGAAEALRAATHVPVPPADRTDYERTVAAARAQLGEVNFASAWAAGCAMTLEQAVAYALEETGQ